ncbi:MAG: hypothetical protein Q9219_005667 [cf. Caloplaca sp. 3 TL-2023]
MADSRVSNSKTVDELDDMVYISDKEDDNETKEPSVKVKPGMIPAVKNLYPGDKDDRGRFTTTDKIPDDLPEPEETAETGQYALLIRNNKCYDGRKSLSIASVVVQSPLLKKVLCWVLEDYPCMAPELDRLEVVSPFRPFVHRWQRLTDALNNERDPETKSHIQLFYDALKKELEVTLEARDDFIAHKTITFNSLWMLFEPGDILFTTINKRPIAAKLKWGNIWQGRQEDCFRLECEMIYGNGTMFGWGQPRFDIPDFDGMSKITDLCIYPLKYHQKVGKITKQLINNGKAYEQLMGFHHKQYQGVALDGRHPFYVDSRIVIDPDAYKCYNPDHDLVLKPLGKSKAFTSSHSRSMDGDSEDSDDSSDQEELTYKQTSSLKKKPVPALTEDQLLLCGSSVKGYSLRNKRWLDFFVDDIKDIDWDEHVWDNVVMENELKDLIFSMTDGHRRKQNGLQSKGLNILLSGPSGVGKTFTVESLADALRAPLFHVTPADVDLDPKNPDLESPFTDVLEMCGRWNAVLLFDHAQGSFDGDQLDDDEGQDCMDERLQSRFHVHLELPELTSTTRGQIWQKCLESQKDFSFFANPKALADWILNGREIANAVTAARTLAMNGVIEMKHLERVVPAGKKPLPIIEDDWGFAPKKEKKKKSKKLAADMIRQGTPDFDVIVEEPPKTFEDDWGSWGSTKKSKKAKEKAPLEHDATRVKNDVQDALVDEDDPWACWGSYKKEKSVKKSSSSADADTFYYGDRIPTEANRAKKSLEKPFEAPPPPPPAQGPEVPLVEEKAADMWDFGGKKEKKTKKASLQVTELAPPPPPPPKAEESTPEIKGESVPEVNEWDFRTSSKKSKKGKKKMEIEEDAPTSVATTSSRPPPPLTCVGCRTCVEYQPVVEGHGCKRCGTQEGNFKVVCQYCAVAKGYNQFELTNVPCEVCDELIS